MSEEIVAIEVPTGSPEEFQSDVELAILNEFSPDELRQLRQRFERDGREAIRAAAEDFVAEETDNREAYVNAMADAFVETLES